MDKLAAINTGHTALNENVISKQDHDVRKSVSGERKKDMIKAAKEMESLFAYQLIKTMRETASALSTDNKGLGNNTYMSMFDMEVSKLFAERGFGLQKAIVNWMERMPQAAGNNIITSTTKDDEKH